MAMDSSGNYIPGSSINSTAEIDHALVERGPFDRVSVEALAACFALCDYVGIGHVTVDLQSYVNRVTADLTDGRLPQVPIDY